MEHEIARHRRTGGSANPHIKITAYPTKVSALPDLIRVTQCHNYAVVLNGEDTHVANLAIKFHSGSTDEGANGITEEALIAILIDRLERFQGTAYRCRQNALALTNLEQALMWLGDRTAERAERGVEGTMEP